MPGKIIGNFSSQCFQHILHFRAFLSFKSRQRYNLFGAWKFCQAEWRWKMQRVPRRQYLLFSDNIRQPMGTDTTFPFAQRLHHCWMFLGDCKYVRGSGAILWFYLSSVSLDHLFPNGNIIWTLDVILDDNKDTTQQKQIWWHWKKIAIDYFQKKEKDEERFLIYYILLFLTLFHCHCKWM